MISDHCILYIGDEGKLFRTGIQTLRGGGTDDYSVDSLTNRYTAIDASPLGYDAAGNLTQDKDGYRFTYDHENRIIEVRNSSDSLVAQMDYDTQGRRIRVYDAVAGTTTLYYYSDNWQVLSQYTDGTLDKSFVYGNYIDEVLVMLDGASTYFYLHDHLYSPVALLNPAGTVVERYEYDAYGKASILAFDFSPLSSSAYGNRILFTGREVDSLDNGSLPLQYNRHRYLSQTMGRWYNPDPYGVNPDGGKHNVFRINNQLTNGINLYQYVMDCPQTKTDPHGLIPWSPYPGVGPYHDLEGGSLQDLINWFSKRNCTPWENDGKAKVAYHSQGGCRKMDILEAVGPIFDIVGLPGSVVVGIAGEVLDMDIIVCNEPMGRGWPHSNDGLLCQCRTYYKKKCKRTCCQFGKQRPDYKTLKLGYYRYGRTRQLYGGDGTCDCDMPPGYTPESLREAIEAQLDCSKLN